MRLPLFVIFDVTSLPDGSIAIGGTDEYVAENFELSEERLRGRTGQQTPVCCPSDVATRDNHGEFGGGGGSRTLAGRM